LGLEEETRVCQFLETHSTYKEVRADLVKEVLFHLSLLLMTFGSRTLPLVLAFEPSFWTSS